MIKQLYLYVSSAAHIDRSGAPRPFCKTIKSSKYHQMGDNFRKTSPRNGKVSFASDSIDPIFGGLSPQTNPPLFILSCDNSRSSSTISLRDLLMLFMREREIEALNKGEICLKRLFMRPSSDSHQPYVHPLFMTFSTDGNTEIRCFATHPFTHSCVMSLLWRPRCVICWILLVFRIRADGFGSLRKVSVRVDESLELSKKLLDKNAFT